MPTAKNPLLMDCSGCGGDGGHEAGCRTCDGRGQEELVGCPWAQVPADVWLALEAAKQETRGHWPVDGGWLEQTRVCLDAVELMRSIGAAKRRDDSEQEV